MRRSEKAWLEKLNQIIESNLDNPAFDSEWICRESGISRSQLYRLVKEHSALSPSLYFRQRKLIRAKDLLADPDLKIAEIAYRLGIDSPQNFSKYFAQEFGISPSDYRKKLALPLSEPAESFQDTHPESSPVSPPSAGRKFIYSGFGAMFILLVLMTGYFRKSEKAVKAAPRAGMTSNPQAYREYVLGLELISSRTQEKLEAGLEKFSNAIALDSQFAMAYANRSVAYYLLGEGGFLDEDISTRLAEQNSMEAIRLDAGNSLAYANLANLYRSLYKWAEAKKAYQIALVHDPENAVIHYWYSLLLRSTGNLEEAIRHSSKATELNPLDHVINGGHIINCIYGGELETARKVLKEGELLFNDAFTYYWTKGTYFAVKEDYTSALECYTEASRRNPQLKVVKYQIVFCKARAGQTEEVNAYLENLPDLPENYVSRSVIYAGLNDKEKSLFYLQKATDHNILPTDLKVLPFLDILRGDSRYKAILGKFGL